MLNAALGILNGEIHTLIAKQLDQSYFVERMPNGRINVLRFCSPNERLRVSTPDFSEMLLKVKFQIEGKKQTAHVTFYKGYLFSAEFKQPSKSYAGKDLVICKLETGVPRLSCAEEIDRLEHGENV